MQRRFFRSLVVGVSLVASAAGLAACNPVVVVDLAVNDGGDRLDVVPGDGICEATAGVGDCTLRAAITEANALAAAAPSPDTAPAVTVTLGIDAFLAIGGTGEDDNLRGDLDIHASITVRGQGHSVNASDLDRVLDVHAGTTVLDQLTVANGTVAESGAGARSASGATLSVVRSFFAYNDAQVSGTCYRTAGLFPPGPCSPGFVDGGGAIRSAGILNVVASTFAVNTVGVNLPCQRVPIGGAEVCGVAYGGAIFATGPTTVVESTFSQNYVMTQPEFTGTNGVGVYASGAPVSVRLSTFVDNGHPDSSVTGATVQGSIVVSSFCPSPTSVDADHNLRSSLPCSSSAAQGVGSLGSFGGPTLTRVPTADSLALEAIPVGTPGLCDGSITVDQRALPRPSGSACDIGAVERQPGDA